MDPKTIDGQNALFLTTEDWFKHLSWEGSLIPIYGNNTNLLKDRLSVISAALNAHRVAFGRRDPVALVRCPSRINWEGHHVDHQGGCYNATTEAREVIIAVSRRGDEIVSLCNEDGEEYPPVQFSGGSSADLGWGNFPFGSWKALRERFPQAGLFGANIALASDIPSGGGMSSSHAILVSSFLAFLALSRLSIEKKDAVGLIQKADWYAGARTGLGDQATMLFGKRGHLFHSRVGRPEDLSPEYVALPEEYEMVLIDSYTQHTLSGEAAVGYNSRVFACKIGLPILLESMKESGADPKALKRVVRPADITPGSFDMKIVYGALLKIPREMTLQEARSRWVRAVQEFPSGQDFDSVMEDYFGGSSQPATIPVRGVMLYTLAECWRSLLYPRLLRERRIVEAGLLVNIGHDGDRVCKSGGGQYRRDEHPTTDEYLQSLLALLDSKDENRRRSAQLQYQRGDYGASNRELDEIVDIARSSGAVSASLTGGGHGGVVTVMIARENLDRLQDRIFSYYIDERNLDRDQANKGLRRCITVDAAGYVTMGENHEK